MNKQMNSGMAENIMDKVYILKFEPLVQRALQAKIVQLGGKVYINSMS